MERVTGIAPASSVWKTEAHLSRPHPHYPYTETGVKCGDEQFARDWNWSERGIYALIGMGVEPG